MDGGCVVAGARCGRHHALRRGRWCRQESCGWQFEAVPVVRDGQVLEVVAGAPARSAPLGIEQVSRSDRGDLVLGWPVVAVAELHHGCVRIVSVAFVQGQAESNGAADWEQFLLHVVVIEPLLKFAFAVGAGVGVHGVAPLFASWIRMALGAERR